MRSLLLGRSPQAARVGREGDLFPTGRGDTTTPVIQYDRNALWNLTERRLPI